MNYSCRAISLLNYKYGEESIIAKIFTEEYGLISYSVKRGRSKKSKNKISLLQHMSLINISAQKKQKNEIQFLKEISLSHSLINSYLNINKQLLRMFMAEVLEKILVSNEQDKRLFNFIWNEIILLDTLEKVSSNYALNYLLSITYYLGFYPSKENIELDFFDLEKASFVEKEDNRGMIIKGENLVFFKSLLINNNNNIPYKNRKEILKLILKYYKTHYYNLENIKSFDVIDDMR
ncbi:MAG: DNA repair protein RecO [Flavobacteriales bacterium]|jgi:DNA repair protein RecO (recombination protein O)|tara:strand:+ start:54678 stop:55382 length:705 start_codon:yes stop_codon:yes gene_type:complete